MLSKLKRWLFPSPEEPEDSKQQFHRRMAERKGKKLTETRVHRLLSSGASA